MPGGRVSETVLGQLPASKDAKLRDSANLHHDTPGRHLDRGGRQQAHLVPVLEEKGRNAEGKVGEGGDGVRRLEAGELDLVGAEEGGVVDSGDLSLGCCE